MILINPTYPESESIINEITTLTVDFIGFDGAPHTGVIEIHRSVGKDILLFFQKAYELGFPFEEVSPSSTYNWDDEVLIANNVTSGFNYRYIKGTEKLSLHARGLAFDVNTRLNPYIRYTPDGAIVSPTGALYDSTVPGTLTTDHPLVVLMKKLGWEWGGDWTQESGRVDYQHFQKMPSSNTVQ